jgi:hypothetical protein
VDPFAAAADAATAMGNTLKDRSVSVKTWFDEADVMFSWEDERSEAGASEDGSRDEDAGVGEDTGVGAGGGDNGGDDDAGLKGTGQKLPSDNSVR